MAHLDNAVATEEFKHMNNLLEPIALVSGVNFDYSYKTKPPRRVPPSPIIFVTFNCVCAPIGQGTSRL